MSLSIKGLYSLVSMHLSTLEGLQDFAPVLEAGVSRTAEGVQDAEEPWLDFAADCTAANGAYRWH